MNEGCDVPVDTETRPRQTSCWHRDLCDESTIETINGSSWCTSCGALIKGETA